MEPWKKIETKNGKDYYKHITLKLFNTIEEGKEFNQDIKKGFNSLDELKRFNKTK
jgi:hypothetical protein